MYVHLNERGEFGQEHQYQHCPILRSNPMYGPPQEQETNHSGLLKIHRKPPARELATGHQKPDAKALHPRQITTPHANTIYTIVNNAALSAISTAGIQVMPVAHEKQLLQ